MPKQRISVLILGEISHRDCAIPIKVKQAVETIHASGLPLVFGNEGACDTTSQQWLALLKGEVQGNKDDFDRFKQLKAVIRRDKKRPYFDISDTVTLETKLRSLFKHLPQGDVRAHAAGLTRQFNLIELTSLAETLIKLNIPYQGLEADEKQRSKMGDAFFSQGGASVAHNYELKRCPLMVSNVFNIIHNKLKNNSGVIVIFCGATHAHRIASMLHVGKSKREDCKNLELQIIATQLYSPYSEDCIDGFDFIRKNLPQNDTPDVRQAYRDIPCYRIYLYEDKVSGEFASADFNALVKKSIDFVQPRVSQFYIPNFTPAKQAKIAELGGKVISPIPDAKSAVVELDSKLLLKAERDALGIDRVAAQLPQDQINYLRNFSSITFEKADDPKKCLLTFSSDKRALINQLTDAAQWKAIKDKLQADQQSLMDKVSANKKLLSRISVWQKSYRAKLQAAKKVNPGEKQGLKPTK